MSESESARGGRWYKGMPTPNPRGRPKTAHLKKLVSAVDPGVAALLSLDRRQTSTLDEHGNPMSVGDLIDMQLQRDALNGGRFLSLYLKFRDDARKRENEIKQDMLMAAVSHKDLWLGRFLWCERLGKPLPNVLPDPRDIYIHADGSVEIDGPVTREQKSHLDAALQLRDELLSALMSLGSKSDEMAKRTWLRIRRRIYRLHAAMPRRLRVPLPSARTSVGLE